MPQLTFPIIPDGLIVDTRVNLDPTGLASAHASGLPLPASVGTKALIDTGANITAVSPSILQQLGVIAHSQRKTQGISGSVQVRLFQVTLFILDAGQVQLPWLTVPNLLVMELPTALPVGVLIGMDIVRTCKLLVDGPASQFTLDF